MILRTRIATLCSLVAIGGCSEDDVANELEARVYLPVPGCEAIDHAPCDIRDERCQSQRFALAACLRGEEPGALPAIRSLDEAALVSEIEAAYAEEPRPSPDHWENALSLLELVQPGDFQPSAMAAARAEWLGGYYDSDTQSITIVDRGTPADDADTNALLVHELVHALQDREVDLDRYDEEFARTFDASLASAAVVEGEAKLLQLAYASSLHGLDPAAVELERVIEEMIARRNASVVASPSPYLIAHMAFVYSYGARLALAARKANGHEGVLSLFASPPSATLAVLAPPGQPFEALPTPPIEPPESAPADGLALVDETVLGAWGLFLVASRTVDADEARSIALDWRADALFVYGGTTDPETALVWHIELVDESAAARAANVLGSLGGAPTVERAGVRLVVTAAWP